MGKAVAAAGNDGVRRFGPAAIAAGSALDHYASWLPPTCIVSDGPYGLGIYPGEARTTDDLATWYAAHAAEWGRLSRPDTMLWFWNSEIGWAMAHPAIAMHGWEYQEAVVWDKGVQHIADHGDDPRQILIQGLLRLGVGAAAEANGSGAWVQCCRVFACSSSMLLILVARTSRVNGLPITAIPGASWSCKALPA